MVKYIFNIVKLMGVFFEIFEEVVIDFFIWNWFDLFCFLFLGLLVNGISVVEVVFMFVEWYRLGVVFDYFIGGSGVIVDVLVRGLKCYGG